MLDDKRKEKLRELLSKLNIKEEVNLNLIQQALTHPSYLSEEGNKAHQSNQRLEFLGDAVLGLVMAEKLYTRYPKRTEGELTKMRALIVCEASLYQVAQEIGLGSYLLMGKGEEYMGGAKRPSNLADSLEALLGALYLSLGLERVKSIVTDILKAQIKNAARGKSTDYKTKLQEYVQKNPNHKVSYQIYKEEGPDHEKVFWAAVYINETKSAVGKGHTKKEAEQQAARHALFRLGFK